MFEYPVKIEKDTNGTFLVTFPDVPEAVTFGDTRAEALSNAVEALETCLSFYIESNTPLPKPSAAQSRKTVYPTIKGTMKLALYHAMKTKNMSKADLARQMKCRLVQIDRLLDLCHSSRLEQLEEAFAALGQKVHLKMVAS